MSDANFDLVFVVNISTVDKLWDDLWLQDKRKKDERAERDEQNLRERNRIQKELLDAQVASINESRQQEALLRAQEQQLRVCLAHIECFTRQIQNELMIIMNLVCIIFMNVVAARGRIAAGARAARGTGAC